MKEGGSSLNKTFREYNLVFKGLKKTCMNIISSAGLDLPLSMEAHFPRKAPATDGASSPKVVLLAVLNYHRLSQKCIGSGKFDCLSIALSASDYCTYLF